MGLVTGRAGTAGDVAWGGDCLGKQCVPERVLSIRRIRGWVDAEPIGPRVALGVNLKRVCVVQRRNQRVAKATTAARRGVRRRLFGEAMRSRTGASYSPHSRLGWRRTDTTPGCVGRQFEKGVCRPAAQPTRRQSNDSGKTWREAAIVWRSNAFPYGCFLFAAFAAGLAQNRYDPGLPPGATLGRSYAAL